MSDEHLIEIEGTVYYCTNPAHSDYCRLFAAEHGAIHLPAAPGLTPGDYSVLLICRPTPKGENE